MNKVSKKVTAQEETLHIAICQAVSLMNIGDWRPAHIILRKALIAYADATDAKPTDRGEKS